MLITIFAIIIFILLFIRDHKEHLSKQKKAKEIKQKEQQKHEEVKRNILSTIYEILNSLHDVWNKYQEATKDIYQQKKLQ